ncbi:hypothetical protein VTK73DRAFT_135 [Phialemonium thermophilum]|uniref:RGS domain-containing protein n=1 Tax=Phialemonium thermophilum TaxID=223376 RepID=A0ABR3Y429_9PEZI
MSSRPASLALLPTSSNYIAPPSLQEILSNTAPPPWSLSAFMAFLSQNHCLETLEFTMDADRYKAAFSDLVNGDGSWVEEKNIYVCSLWQKLMNAYIQPFGPRELNLPSPVRDRLLRLPAQSTPPDPSELDEAIHIVYELMNDSVLGPFLQSVAPSCEQTDQCSRETQESRQRRSMMRLQSNPSLPEESGRSPKSHFLPLFGLSRSSEQAQHVAGSSSEAGEFGLSDDTGSIGSSPHDEPTTPPTTPPTPEWATSGPLQRAISAHNSGWKKMGQKLGINRKSREKRAKNSSVTSAGNAPL